MSCRALSGRGHCAAASNTKSECRQCLPGEASEPVPLRYSLSVASVGFFLMPLLLAGGGALAGGDEQAGQLLATLAGLVTGMGVAAVFAKAVSVPRSKE